MLFEFSTPLEISKFLIAISSMNGLSDPYINNHNLRVAYISYLLGRKLSFSNDFLYNLISAGLLHDIGILLIHTKEDINLLKTVDPKEERKIHLHAEVGYEILKKFPYFSKIARIIRYHHYTYKEALRYDIPFSSSIVHLADRIDVFIINNVDISNPYKDISKVKPKLIEFLKRQKGTVLNPKLTDLFLEEIVEQEAFWYELLSEECIKSTVEDLLKNFEIKLPPEMFFELANILAYLIDFKSPFTATHSSGVAQTATALASLFRFTAKDMKRIKIAGLIHDIGKVAIPLSILEKPGRLTQEEIDIMRSHVFYSYKIISKLNIDDDIIEWACCHHETLDGKGYPFKIPAKELSLGARIMAVADIFTALMEDRPYKKGLSTEETLKIIEDLANKNKLDKRVVKVLKKNIKSVDMQAKEVQRRAKETYQAIRSITAHFL